MKLKNLKKKIRRLEKRLQEAPKKLARLKQKLQAAEAAKAMKAARKSAARATAAKSSTGAMKPSSVKKPKKKLNLSPERRAQLSAAMKARWAAKRAAEETKVRRVCLQSPSFSLLSSVPFFSTTSLAPTCAAELRVSRTCHEVIVHHAGRLHQCIADR